jgi:phosphatidylinositol 4-kinase
MQVLWNSSCLDSLLFSIHNESPSAVVNDPAWMVAVRSLYQKIVREWIVKSLSYAPCTSQGLLQVHKYTNILLSLLLLPLLLVSLML